MTKIDSTEKMIRVADFESRFSPQHYRTIVQSSRSRDIDSKRCSFVWTPHSERNASGAISNRSGPLARPLTGRRDDKDALRAANVC